MILTQTEGERVDDLNGSATRLGVAVDATSSIPPYEQVRSQLAALISNRQLAAGTRLPSVRALAVDLGLAANTVARTYRELESAGLVETRGRGGTVVSASGDDARARLVEAARAYAELAHTLGLSNADAAAMITSALTNP